MRVWDLTLSSPAENLAADEALLDLCESGGADEVLRFWQPTGHFVVVGYANKVGSEVDLAFCEAEGIPILRRCTGGGTVLQGPGVLNYSLVLRIEEATTGAGIAATNDFVLRRHRSALTSLLQRPVQHEGHTDLALDGLKFSGNAQRRRKTHLLFHGCFLLSLDLGLVAKALRFPSQQPAYRANRAHLDFLVNLPIPVPGLKSQLAQAWQAIQPLPNPPLAEIAALARERYSRDSWNRKF